MSDGLSTDEKRELARLLRIAQQRHRLIRAQTLLATMFGPESR